MGKCSFKIVRDCDLSVFEQIKSQIISSLYTGKIQEGDQLPSVRELAKSIDVNHKTIHKIYCQLKDEHYIRMIQGKGVYIQTRDKEDYSHLRREAILKLMGNTLEKASMLGLGGEKFGHLLMRYCTGTDLKSLPCIIVDDEEELMAFSGELQRKLKVHIYPVRLDEMEKKLSSSNAELESFNHVLTTSWHMEQVRPFARELGKNVLEIKPNPDIYHEIVALIKEKNVGVIVRDMKTIHASFEVFMNIFYPSTERKFIITPINNKELLERISCNCEVVFASPFCWNEVRKIIPSHREVRTFTDLISDDFISYLKVLQLFE